MAKPYPGDWVLRTLLFVPGHNEKLSRKAAETDADCVVLDIEDSVPPESKDDARVTIRRLLEEGCFRKKPVFVRVNSLETGRTLRDVDSVACEELQGFVYPMTMSPEDILIFSAQLEMIESERNLPSGFFSIIPVLETPLGVINAYPIAKASSRTMALIFGCEDYLADVKGTHYAEDVSLLHARMQLILAARAVGAIPLDAAFVHVHDIDGFVQFASRARALGMGGTAVLSPKQIPTAHAVYSPTEEQTILARKIVDGAEQAKKENKGVVIIDGVFVSPPTLKGSLHTMHLSNAIAALEEFKKNGA
ncbi:MAG: CoA ester lyase [bacterium]|nr:CoA ester lyase [bacterium]